MMTKNLRCVAMEMCFSIPWVHHISHWSKAEQSHIVNLILLYKNIPVKKELKIHEFVLVLSSMIKYACISELILLFFLNFILITKSLEHQICFFFFFFNFASVFKIYFMGQLQEIYEFTEVKANTGKYSYLHCLLETHLSLAGSSFSLQPEQLFF